MSNPLLQHHKSKVALDALLEDFADPRHGNGDGDFHVDPDYNNPMGQKGTEPENVHYGAPEGGYDIHCRECGAPITEYEQMMHKDCLAGTDYHSIGAEEMGLLLDDWMSSGTLAKQGTEKMCTCGCPMSGHVKPPDFGCPNEPGCGCKGATEAKTGKLGDKTEDPRMRQWMLDFVQENPVNETFPQYIQRRSAEPAKAMAQHASVKEGEAPLPTQNHDEVDPLLAPADKIFKRSLEAVLAAAGGRAFMYSNFRTAEDARDHLFETMRVASAPKTDFRTVWAWATQYFPKRAAVEQKMAPKILPPSGMRSHLDEDVKDDINNMVKKPVMEGPKGVHIGAGNLKWRVDAPPVGRYRSFDRRGWPSADYPNGDIAARIECADEYIPANVRAGTHAPLTVYVAAWRQDPEERKQKGAFGWRKLTQQFATLKEATDATNKIVAAHPELHPEAPGAKTSADQKYPDSVPGALACLQELSDGLDLQNATAKPDPSVRGVWQVTLKSGQRAIVYLAGYPDPMGKVRPYSDFEIEDEQPTTASMTDDTGAVTGLRNRPDYGESDSYTSEANRSAKTGDLGEAMRIDNDDHDEYFMDQVQDAKREAYQSFLEDGFYQQEAQDNGWTMEELWKQIGEEYTNEYWQSRNASVKNAPKLAACPNCKSAKVLPVQDVKIKSASGTPLQECMKCGSFFTF